MESTKVPRRSLVSLLFFAFLLLLECSTAPTSAADYAVQVLLDLSGPNTLQYAQWVDSFKVAASEVSLSWAPSDSLNIDIFDTQGRLDQLQTLGALAIDNSSVIAVISDEQGYKALSGFASNAQLPLLIVPSSVQVSGGSSSGSTSFIFSAHNTLINALQAVMAKYSWTKLGLLHSLDDDGTAVRAKLSSLSGLNVTYVSIPSDSVDQTAYAQAAIRERINVIVVANRNMAQASALFRNPYMSILSTTGSTIVYLNELGSLPTSLPLGCFVIDEVDAVPANRTAFEAKLGTSELLKGSILASDSVKTLALAIEHASSSGPVDRISVITALRSTDYWGDSGRLQFDSTGNRISRHAEIWNTNSSTSYGSLSLSMVYEDSTLTELSPPCFGGGTMIPTDDKTTFIPVASLLALTSPIIPTSAISSLRSLFAYYIYWINQQPDLLPPKTKLLNAVIDTAGQPSIAVQGALIAPLIGSVAVFGDYSAAITPVIQSVVSAYNLPHVSTTPGSVLSNKLLYPTLTRTVSTSVSEGEMIIALARYYGWTELSIISSSENLGSDAAQVVLNQAPSLGITVEHHLILNSNYDLYDSQFSELWKHQPQVIVLLAGSDNLIPLMSAFYRSGYKPAAVITDILSTQNVTSLAGAIGVPDTVFQGWISMASPVGVGALWQEFIHNATLADPTKWGAVPSLLQNVVTTAIEMDGFVVIAKSIKRCVENGQSPTNGTALLAAIRSFTGNLFSGEVFFDSNGDRTPTFDLFNSLGGKLTKVGRWTQESGLVLSSDVTWPSGSTQVPLSYIPRRQTWLKWSSGAGIVLGVLAILGIILCAAMLGIIYMWRESPIVSSATYEFLILMLFGAALGFGSTMTWIGKPVPFICGLRIWLPPIAFLLIISPLMAKTWRLWKIFSLSDLKVVPVPLRTLVLIVSAMILVQIIICIVWISIGTIQPIIVIDPNDRTLEYVLCKSNSTNRISSYVTFGYIGLILLVGCYLAFKIRKLPRDFNESKWIGRTLYNIFLFAGLIIILGYALSRFYVVVLILICVCTLAICYGSIMLMMGPKIYTMIKHPEKRSSSSESSKNTEMRGSVVDTASYKQGTDFSRKTRTNSKNTKSLSKSSGGP